MDERKKKRNYYVVRTDNSEWAWCYSAKGLQNLLNRKCQNETLIRCLAEACGYLDAERHGNLLDLSYMGGTVLLFFENAVLEFEIFVEGQVRYRISKPWNVHIRPANGRIPEDYLSNPIYFCDVKNDFALTYEGAAVRDVKIDRTNMWCFSAADFDERIADQAAEANDLPAAIHFTLDNGADLCLIADQLEYYMIELKQEG